MEETKYMEEIKYEHYRCDLLGVLRRYYRSNTNWTPVSRGGMTICTISVGGKEFQGIAKCDHYDAFCYRLGRMIALGRARKEEREAQIDAVEMKVDLETAEVETGPEVA